MSVTAHSALRNAVNVRAHAPCPMCCDDEWIASESLSLVPELDRGGTSIEVLAFVCRNCGFVRLHAVQPLETIDA
ncbi:MAG TPA: hypothetical protein VFA66_06805 [Gaiellaceae bacterium]|nr:hypothetical protein [Gaiellaceae bacterium]